jgi:hypothetical protein
MIDFNVVIPFPLPEKSNYDRDAILATLQTTAYLWVPEVFPQGKIDHVKKELRVADISGRPPRKQGSCVVQLDGEHAGGYKDFSLGGKGGNAIDTIADHLGVTGLAALEKAHEVAERYGRVDGHKAPAQKRSTSSSEKHLSEANHALTESGPAAGTLVETYFAARGLQLPATDDLKFNPNLTHWETKTGKPALVAVIRYPDGRPTGGIHRIYLKEDGSYHIGDKMMLGPVDGVVMLAPISEDGTIGIAEGIETAAAAMRMFGVPCWSTLSDGGMKKFAAWIAERGAGPLKRLVIFADKGAAGESAAAVLRATAEAVGIQAEVRLPRGGDDFNDDLQKGLFPMDGGQVPQTWQPKQPQETSPPASRGGKLPVIQVGGGSLPYNVDAAEFALIDRDRSVYQRGDFLVRPAPSIIQISDRREITGIRLVRMSVTHLIERMTRVADFQKYDARTKKWHSIDCPANIAATLIERIGQWRLPPIAAVMNCPTLRPDGSILDQPGYDVATGILYDPRGIEYPPIPHRPSKDDAIRALAVLKEPIAEFRFLDDASRSVSLSCNLTAPVRGSLPTAPMHSFTAPVAGSGKGKLVDISSIIACGHEAPVITPGEKDEFEKRLGSQLLAGDAVISLDNCNGRLGGDLLCQALTQANVKVRILGKSETPTVPNNALISANGNNLILVGDLTRRAIMGSLDPQCERPELRTFKNKDLIGSVKRNRAQLLVACLTILRAFNEAGRPDQGGAALGSFETWWHWVRGALVWLGEADPCETMEKVREDDPRRRALENVMTYWKAAFGNEDLTVREVVERSTDYVPSTPRQGVNFNPPPRREFIFTDLRDALIVVASERGMVDSERLGVWLRSVKGRIINNMRLVQGFKKRSWKLEVVQPVQP